MYIKLAFYLDPLARETGSLRVIPGSHRIGEPFADRLEREIRASELYRQYRAGMAEPARG